MFRRRLVLFVFASLSTAALFLFMKLPVVLEAIAISKLEAIGATDIKLELDDVGLSSTQLGELSFILEKGGRRYSISSHDASVLYVFSDLFTGHLETVNIPKITVRVEEFSSGVASEQGSILSPDDWLSSIPFKKLNLEFLKLDWRTKEGRTWQVKINGTLGHDHELANAHFDIHTEKYGTQRFDLKLAPAGASQLQLSNVSTESAPVTYIKLNSGAWIYKNKQLHVDVGIDIDVQTLQQQLQRWGIVFIPQGSAGSITLKGPLHLQQGSKPSWQSAGKISLQLPSLKNIGKQFKLDAPVELALNEKQVQWQFGEGTLTSIKKVSVAKIRAKSMTAKLLKQASCNYQLESDEWACQPFTMNLVIPSIKNKKNSIAFAPSRLDVTSLTGTTDTWSSSLDVDLPSWLISIGNDKSAKQIRFDKVYGSIDASNEKLHAKLALVTPNTGVTLHVNAMHKIKSNSGKALYRLEPIIMPRHAGVFANTYSDWPAELLLDTGTIGIAGEIAWQQGELLPAAKASLAMKDVGGRHDEISFAGLDGTLDIIGLTTLRIRSRQKLHLANLDVGAPITDVTLQTEVLLPSGGQVKGTVTDIAMRVVGGEITGKQIEFDLAREQNPFTLQVSGVDVEELLKLEQEQGLIGTGLIDGELPLVLTRKGISMQDGQLSARKPGGKLKYSANEGVQTMAETNPGVKLLVTAMEDFTYKVLEAIVDYTPDGLLKLKVRLEGSNPELEGGRPVHLNVDVEDNVLELLRSLRLASEISEKIGERVQKRQSGK